MLSHRPRGPGRALGATGRAPGSRGAAGRAGGPRSRSQEEERAARRVPADGQTDSAATHKVESTTNSAGGCSVSYFMDECTVGFRDRAAAARHRLPPRSGPRVTGEPLSRPPHPAQTPGRSPLPPVACPSWVQPTREMPRQLLGCPEGWQGGRLDLLQLGRGPSAGPATRGQMPG
ncbi:uncharacterized protein LOC125962135 [Orcinus orca]|uniref:uncharacterized protein LOC125962135 n=1 Tax=Orcinus orca TaxID=9733 RepID=UPI002112F6F1|nr:uncharacterized protein LOC125962135 [Orcinus orca]